MTSRRCGSWVTPSPWRTHHPPSLRPPNAPSPATTKAASRRRFTWRSNGSLRRPLHIKAVRRRDGGIAGRPSGTQHNTGAEGVEDSILQQATQDVNRKDLAEHQPRLGGPLEMILQLHDLRDLALEVDRAFGDTRWSDATRGRGRQPGKRKLVGLVRDSRTRRIHVLGNFAGRQVPDELARFAR